jgi:hypothetical protein
MLHLLCRNRVSDFQRWWSVFTSHAAAHRAAGLVLMALWQEQADPHNVYFLFQVEDPEAAKAFMAAPQAAEAATRAGVVEGEYHFLTPASADQPS